MLLSLLASPALAWGYHYLMTGPILSHPSTPWAAEAVAVEPLDTFLGAEAKGVEALFAEFYTWLGQKGSLRYTAIPFDTANPNTAAFLRSARINPAAELPTVRRLLPGEAAPDLPVLPLASVSSVLHEVPPFRYDFVDPGTSMTSTQVLSTYIDEPDWGYDHALWGHTEYGYGEQPFGKPEGESSKAPFHMYFGHENFLVKAFAPEVTENIMVERVELFARLSELALRSGHAYWGYRFAAWSAHYLQDLAQPYHAKALPSVGGGYYVRYAVSPNKDKLKTRATQLAANRHFLYEDFVALKLQEHYTAPDDTSRALVGALAGGAAGWTDTTVGAIMARLSKDSSAHARTIDRTIRTSFEPRMVEDESYDLETDAAYDVAKTMAAIPDKERARLLAETVEDFERAGLATRTLLGLVRP